ncbi:MAG: hypothetical protein PGN12_07435 [Sphingomonas phyllosphaerae]
MADPFETAGNHRGVDTSIAAAELAALTSNHLRYLVHKTLCEEGAAVAQSGATLRV